MFNVIFLGTSEFAVPSLKSLLNDRRFRVLAVVTQPDKPAGRHAELTPPPVKVTALKYHLPVFQPTKIKELETDENLKKLLDPQPDAFVVVSYGKILPPWFLEIPRAGIVNVHASLLPRWRGASPIQAAIAAGDHTTGVTIMKIDELLDHGPIIAQAEELIEPTDTGGTLHDRLAEHGGDMLPNVLADYLDGKIKPREQDHNLATECRTLTRDDGKIDWNHTSEQIEHQVRAYDPWPGTWMELDGKRLKILAVRIRPNDAAHHPGKFFIWKNRPSVACGQGTVIELTKVQPEGKKPMSGEDFVRGYSTGKQ
jgi:methionyl-tRNA formyltransferase